MAYSRHGAQAKTDPPYYYNESDAPCCLAWTNSAYFAGCFANKYTDIGNLSAQAA